MSKPPGPGEDARLRVRENLHTLLNTSEKATAYRDDALFNRLITCVAMSTLDPIEALRQACNHHLDVCGQLADAKIRMYVIGRKYIERRP